MAKLVWDAPGERIFEAGLDRGVLYVDGSPGVPWNGLVSVLSKNATSNYERFYMDGFNYYTYHTRVTSEFVIEAYTYPEEFYRCEGIAELLSGRMQVTNQRKERFGLSYRTLVGNDTDSLDHGYKIHLLYNLLATPQDKEASSIGDVTEPFNFAWDVITEVGLTLGSFLPTTHFIIDSRKLHPLLLEHVEALLYGYSGSDSYLPSFIELSNLIEHHIPPIPRPPLVPVPDPDPDLEPPLTPLNLTAVAELIVPWKLITVSWSPSVDAEKYKVARLVEAGWWTVIAETSETSIFDYDIEFGVHYLYVVRAVNQAGESGWTYPVMARLVEDPITTPIKLFDAKEVTEPYSGIIYDALEITSTPDSPPPVLDAMPLYEGSEIPINRVLIDAEDFEGIVYDAGQIGDPYNYLVDGGVQHGN